EGTMQSPESRRSQRGATLVLMAVFLFGMLAMAALAIDLASLRSARSEAQRAADAVALAGAAAFQKYPWTDGLTVDSANVWALNLARVNQVRADTIDVRNPVTTTTNYLWGSVRVVETPQLTLNIIPDSQKVRAWVRHAGVQTFFGGLLAKPYGHVQAMATAWATDEGPEVNCMKPFAMPDMWNENDPDQDLDDDDYMDPITEVTGGEQDGESWKYNPESVGGTDYYLPYDPSVAEIPGRPQTGYGSGLRSSQGYPSDIGLPLLLKPQTGSGNTDPAPERLGNAFWLLDLDPDLNFKEETAGCGNAAVGDTVPYDAGSKTAVRQELDKIVQMDPGAEWNNDLHQVVGSNQSDWTKSPRIFTVALIDPVYWIAGGSCSKNCKPDPGSLFTNFVRIFLMPVEPNGPPENIQALYIGPAPGSGGGPTGGPLVKILQLIE
ncbi:MAG: type IV pilus modification PilV family protein, partial [Gemmatimonadales bacterium]